MCGGSSYLLLLSFSASESPLPFGRLLSTTQFSSLEIVSSSCAIIDTKGMGGGNEASDMNVVLSQSQSALKTNYSISY